MATYSFGLTYVVAVGAGALAAQSPNEYAGSSSGDGGKLAKNSSSLLILLAAVPSRGTTTESKYLIYTLHVI